MKNKRNREELPSEEELHIETYEEYIKRTRRKKIPFERLLFLGFTLVLFCLCLRVCLSPEAGTELLSADPKTPPGVSQPETAESQPEMQETEKQEAVMEENRADVPAVESAAPEMPRETPSLEAETELPAYVPTALYVEEELQGVLASEQAVLELLAEIRTHYAQMAAEEAGVSVEEVEVDFVEPPVYSPAEGSLGEGIVSVEALFEKLTGKKTDLKVRCTVRRRNREILSYVVEEEKDRYLVEGTRIVESLGRDGMELVEITDVYINGKKDGRSREEVLYRVEPVTERIRIGSQKKTEEKKADKEEGRKAPKTELRFVSPIKGSAKVNFGQIDGVLHQGLDYKPEEAEAKVLASCAGTVVAAMERGGYGLMVEIDHGDGFVSRYAGLTSFYVLPGTYVQQGQYIGDILQVGEESKYLHFEIRADGLAYNPRFYLED